jgi:hypothetical protein
MHVLSTNECEDLHCFCLDALRKSLCPFGLIFMEAINHQSIQTTYKMEQVVAFFGGGGGEPFYVRHRHHVVVVVMQKLFVGPGGRFRRCSVARAILSPNRNKCGRYGYLLTGARKADNNSNNKISHEGYMLSKRDAVSAKDKRNQ